ncbi:MAG: DUF5675 family protein [Pseudoalteromonas prydzensis]|uniref:DUF5675 family protein n=1 Tax=Pseudoalteromonas prydzensis TaxID=182141 RepID=UPI003F98DCF9
MKLLLKRFPTPKGIFGTFGELYVDGELFCYTVEREWKNNEGYLFCVPACVYDFLPHESSRYGNC